MIFIIRRSTNYDSNQKDLGSSIFVLIAFVNDVNQAVTEGSDGIEHM